MPIFPAHFRRVAVVAARPLDGKLNKNSLGAYVID
jgi:hypothetical protein